MNERRAFVLGVSGATWTVMRPMIDAGLLPNLERLCRSGLSGDLASVRAPGDRHFRPQTAWPSLATGCLPEHHGITRFFHTAADLVRPTIWQLLSRANRRVGLFGWPMTWPPQPIDGFDIPCHHARDGRTWPPDLQIRRASSDRLRAVDTVLGAWRLARHRVLHPLLPRLARAASHIATQRDPRRRALVLGHVKQEIACELFCGFRRRFQPDASAFVTFLVDWISHRYWRYHDPTTSPGVHRNGDGVLRSAVTDAYRKVDTFLGRITASLPPDTIVAVVSEHGMAPEPVPAEIGPWRYAIHGGRLRTLVGIPDHVDARPIARWIAFRSADGSSLPGDTVSRLRDLRVAPTGLPLFQLYEHRGEVMAKFDLTRAVGEARPEDLEHLPLCWRGREVPFLAVARRADPQRSAMHAEHGVLVLSGPGVRQNGRIEGARIVDFAPTLLEAMGCSFPEVAFDGKVLDVFARA